MAIESVSVQCCIAGGGPAGMVLGLLLARAGVRVLVLEKHADFLRDFRGDTIHPSTLEVLHELDLLEAFLARPHERTPQVAAIFGGLELAVDDFAHLPTRCRYIAFIPQWEFLDFLARAAERFPTFELRMATAVTEIVEEAAGGGRSGARRWTCSGSGCRAARRTRRCRWAASRPAASSSC